MDRFDLPVVPLFVRSVLCSLVILHGPLTIITYQRQGNETTKR